MTTAYTQLVNETYTFLVFQNIGVDTAKSQGDVSSVAAVTQRSQNDGYTQ